MSSRRWLLVAPAGLAAWAVLHRALPNGLPAVVVLQGVVLGSLTGLVAMGLVLVYRASRVVNFAQGALGSAAAVFSVQLFLAWHWNYYLALATGLVAAAVVGALADRLVVQRFFWAPRLILTVATIGMAQVLGGLELALPGMFGRRSAFGGALQGAFRTPLDVRFEVSPLLFGGAHVMVLVVVPVVAIGLAWFLRGTAAGTAIRASSGNAERALLLGIPVRRLSTLVWSLAAVLSALAGMLAAPLVGVSSSVLSGPGVLLPALAAAVLARMDSLPKALGMGMAVGVFQQAIFWNTSRSSLADVGLLVAVLAGLLLQRDRSGRQSDATSSWSGAAETPPVPAELRRLPEVVWGRRVLIVLALAGAIWFPSLLTPSQVSLIGSVALVYALVGVSLVVLTGWAGQVSLGQFAIAGLGGVVAGDLVSKAGADLLLALLAGAGTGALAALAVGLPALRIRGLFLGVTTLALAVPVSTFLLNPANFPSVIPQQVERAVVLQRFDLADERTLYYFCLVVLVAVLGLTGRIRRARPGRAMVAVRDNERAARARGLRATNVRLMAFALSGALAGLAGGLHAVVLSGVRAGSFGPSMSFEAFSMVVLGGATSLTGAVFGAFFLRWAQYALGGGLQLIVTGAGVLIVLLVLPGGLSQLTLGVRQAYLRRVARWRRIPVGAFDTTGGATPGDATALSLDELFAHRRPDPVKDPV